MARLHCRILGFALCAFSFWDFSLCLLSFAHGCSIQTCTWVAGVEHRHIPCKYIDGIDREIGNYIDDYDYIGGDMVTLRILLRKLVTSGGFR